ncbi:hypothetical protein G6009_11245 [Dietzia sp. SLG510A3-30A2]|jgi:hypothetical protein|nr:hypothetical protein [Dietzia sp. SLG510A3-30A2]
MDGLIAIGIFAAFVGGYALISHLVGSASEAVVDAAFAPVGMMVDKAGYNKVSRELSAPHQFRLRAPVEVAQRTLEGLPGIPEHAPGVFAPFYLHKEEGRIKFGISNTVLPNHYDIEVNYRAEPFGVSGELRFLRWPKDAADDVESHRTVVDSVLGELRRLDPGMQVRRPGVAA